jgi:hypothetical protein
VLLRWRAVQPLPNDAMHPLFSGPFSAIIVDESHEMRTGDTRRHAAASFAANVSRSWVAMTGTTHHNSIEDIESQVGAPPPDPRLTGSEACAFARSALSPLAARRGGLGAEPPPPDPRLTGSEACAFARSALSPLAARRGGLGAEPPAEPPSIEWLTCSSLSFSLSDPTVPREAVRSDGL